MDKTETVHSPGYAYRKLLTTGVHELLLEKGIERVEKECLDTLTEIMECLFVQLGQTTRGFCELSGRTLPVVGDIVMAMNSMGISAEGIENYAKRESRRIVPVPTHFPQQKPLSLLQAGTKSEHPLHVLPHFPLFPDPHAYVRTPTHKQPVTEYEAIREKAATQKRDIEKALTKYLTRTSEIHSLFDTEDNMFPLIACKPSFPPYLAALNPTDQVFDFEELEYHYLVANRTEDCKDDDDENESGNEEAVGDADVAEVIKENSPKKAEKREKDAKVDNSVKPNSVTNKAIIENPNIDNPYLRAATLPKKGKPEFDLLSVSSTTTTSNTIILLDDTD